MRRGEAAGDFEPVEFHEPDFQMQKEQVYVRVFDLHSKGLLSQEEAEVVARQLATVKSVDDLQRLEHDTPFSQASTINSVDAEYESFLQVEMIERQLSETLEMEGLGEAWTAKMVAVLSKLPTFGHSPYFRDIVRGEIAKNLFKLCQANINRGRSIEEFGKEMIVFFSTNSEYIPDVYKMSQRERAGKRQPGLLETVSETIECLRQIEILRAAFLPISRGIIIGGSMMYGPFYNVRASTEEFVGSDVDAIVVVKDDAWNTDAWSQLNLASIFSQEEASSFHERLVEFLKLRAMGSADVFSQKFHSKNGGVEVSCHFFPSDQFEKMTNTQLSADVSAGADCVSVLRDFKTKPFPYDYCRQRTFTGEFFPYRVPEQKRVSGGVITELPSYIIQDGSFYPGIYQNLISPLFTIEFDSDGFMKRNVGGFKKIMSEQVEKTKRSGKTAHLFRSHIRQEIFSPVLSKR